MMHWAFAENFRHQRLKSTDFESEAEQNGHILQVVAFKVYSIEIPWLL